MNLYELWRATHTAPYHFDMDRSMWEESMYADTDSDGRILFDTLEITESPGGFIQYGTTAFGFDETGEISGNIHHAVIRDLAFDAPQTGTKLLQTALAHFTGEKRIHAFFHYFGMTGCARHGKLHESQQPIHNLLLENGFVVEHENVYFSRILDGSPADTGIRLVWKDRTPGNCREFAAGLDGQEVCWGQVHFLPQGDIAYLRWIYTAGSRQHQGIGTRVMNELFSSLYRMGIRRFDTDTALTNLHARKYYEKCGFADEGITRSYYTR